MQFPMNIIDILSSKKSWLSAHVRVYCIDKAKRFSIHVLRSVSQSLHEGKTLIKDEALITHKSDPEAQNPKKWPKP